MRRLEVSGAVRPIYGSLGVKRLKDKDVRDFVTEWLIYSVFNDTFSTSQFPLGSVEWHKWAYNSIVKDEWFWNFC